MYSKLRITVLIFITVFLAACEPSVKDGLTYDEYIKMAGEYRSNGDYDRAIAAGKKAVSIKPSDGESHYLLATLYDEGYHKSFDAAQMRALKDAILHSHSRYISDPIKEYKKYGLKAEWGPLAHQEFEETIKYDPRNWFARYMLATDNFNNKHFREAIEEYKRVIAINPNYAASYSLMGEAFYHLGEYNSAIQTLQAAIKIDPSHYYSYYYLGLTYKRTNNWKRYVEIATKLKGMDTSTYNQLVNPEN